MKHFHGDVELEDIRGMDNAEFVRRWPSVRGKRYDGFSRMVGRVGPRVWGGSGWLEDLRPVERVVEFKRNPSLHKCDARCVNAKGFRCECSCLGKNHGAGAFACEAA